MSYDGPSGLCAHAMLSALACRTLMMRLAFQYCLATSSLVLVMVLLLLLQLMLLVLLLCLSFTLPTERALAVGKSRCTMRVRRCAVPPSVHHVLEV